MTSATSTASARRPLPRLRGEHAVPEDEWGNLGATPPVPPNTYGCCTEVGLPGSGDDIGSLPGNKVSVSDSTPGVDYYISTGTVGFVPIWDEADGTGSNGYYHIIGFAGFQITHVSGSKNIQGISAPGDLPRTGRHRVAQVSLEPHWRPSSSAEPP